VVFIGAFKATDFQPTIRLSVAFSLPITLSFKAMMKYYTILKVSCQVIF